MEQQRDFNVYHQLDSRNVKKKWDEEVVKTKQHLSDVKNARFYFFFTFSTTLLLILFDILCKPTVKFIAENVHER